MNRYESVLLDRMVALYKAKCFIAVDNHAEKECDEQIMLLLGCIAEFREPPKSLDVSEGYGAMCEGDA